MTQSPRSKSLLDRVREQMRLKATGDTRGGSVAARGGGVRPSVSTNAGAAGERKQDGMPGAPRHRVDEERFSIEVGSLLDGSRVAR